MTKYRIVPVETTFAMRKAFNDANEKFEDGFGESPDIQWKAMLAAAPSPWISVEERLPDEHKAEYLCLFGDGHQQVSEWLHDETQGWVFWYGDPTHWMPLPEAPEVSA